VRACVSAWTSVGGACSPAAFALAIAALSACSDEGAIAESQPVTTASVGTSAATDSMVTGAQLGGGEASADVAKSMNSASAGDQAGQTLQPNMIATGNSGTGGAGGELSGAMDAAGGAGGDGVSDGAGGSVSLPDADGTGTPLMEPPQMGEQDPPLDDSDDSGAGGAGNPGPSLEVDAGSPDDAPDESNYDIELVFESDEFLSDDVRAAFESATAIWESVIVGDVPDFESPRAPSCDSNRLPTFVDDIIIYVRVE